MSVNIAITADASTAAKAVEAFSKTAAVGLKAVDASGQQAVTSLKAVEVATKQTAVATRGLAAVNTQAVAGIKAMAGGLDASTAAMIRQAIASKNVFVDSSKASDGIADKILSNNRKLKSAIGGIALNATLFAGPQAAQFIYPLVLMQKELKGLTSAAGLLGVTLPMVGAGVLGLAGAVAIGVQGWKAYQAQIEAVAAKERLFAQERSLAKTNAGLLTSNADLDRLPKAEADALKKRLAESTDEGFRMVAERKKVMEFVGGSMGGMGGGRLMEVEKDVYTRVETERRDKVLAIVQARLREINLTEEQLTQMTELRDKTEQLHVATMEGFARERAAEVERFRLETRSIEERAKFAKTIDQPALQLARQSNELLHRKTMAKIEKDEWDDQVKKALELQKVQDETALAEWDNFQRLKHERRDEAIRKVQANPFIDDAERYDQSKALHADMTGSVDPRRLNEQMRAGFAQLRSEWGTLQQQIAQGFYGTINNSVNLVSDGITGLIFQTEGWRQKLAQIPMQILQGIVGAIVQLGVRTIASMVLTAIAGKAIAAASTAALIPIAAAQAELWAAPAALSLIASYGGSAAAVSAVTPAIAAVKAQSLLAAGFSEGGFTGPGGKYDVAGLVHRGEVVWSQDDVAKVGGVRNAEMLRKTGGAGLAAASGPSHLNQTINAFFDKRAFLQAMRDDIGAIALDMVRNNKSKLGIAT